MDKDSSTDQTDYEWHIPGMNFCGPGTDLNKRLNADGTPKPSSLPVDRIDEAALKHDKFYDNHHGMTERLKADKQMLDEINDIGNPTCRECLERIIVNVVFHAKAFLVRLITYFLRLYQNGGGVN